MDSLTDQKNKKKVLIVEDEGDMCLLLNIILTDEDLQIDHVKSLSSAAALLKSHHPDIILLDNKLPDGFGVDFITIVKKLSPSSKIIMLTGYDPSAVDVAVENGADLFLTKPFTKDQLQAAVHSFLESSQTAV